MSSCRIDRRALAPLVVGVALLGSAGAAFAIAPVTPGAGVLVSELGAPDPMRLSLVRPESGALPETQWLRSDPASITAAFAAITSDARSVAAVGLAARALASGGRAPTPDEKIRADLFRARLDAIERIAHPFVLAELAQRSVLSSSDPAVAERLARARLAIGDTAGACATDDDLEGDLTSAFWLRLRTACFALAEEPAAAELTLSLARDLGGDGVDRRFAEWIELAATPAEEPVDTAPRDGVENALARQLGARDFDPAVVANLPLPLVAGIAQDAAWTGPARAAAAWRAGRFGALDARSLAAALDAAARTSAASLPQDVFDAAMAAEGAMRHALLYRTAQLADEPAMKARAIVAALDEAEDASEAVIAARIYAPAIAVLPRQRDALPHAKTFAEAAAVAGDVALARAWLAFLVAGPEGAAGPRTLDGPILLEGAAGPAVDTLAPIPAPPSAARPLDTRTPLIEPLDRTALEALIVAADARATPDQRRDAALARLAAAKTAVGPDKADAEADAAILAALGAAPDPELRRAIAKVAEAAPPAAARLRALISAMNAATRDGAMGEATLYAAAVASEAGLADTTPITNVIGVLRAMGLEADARAIAVEAMVTRRRTA